MDKRRDKLVQIEKELREEMRAMRRQGRLYEFDKAMVNAMEKYKERVKKVVEEELEDYSKEEDKKKLSDLRQKDENQ